MFLNIYPLIIGKAYSSKDLGYYNKANDYAKLPSVTVQDVIQQVTYPILSSIQNDDTQLSSAYRRLIRMSGFIVFPLMFGLASIAEPLIIVLLTEKWINSISLLQILCFAHIFLPIQALNLNILYVKGRSDIVLRIELITKLTLLIFLILTVPLGIKWMCIAYVIYHVLSLFIDMHYASKFIDMRVSRQLYDLAPSFFLASFMAIIVVVVINFIDSLYLKLFIGLAVGAVVYLFAAFIFHLPELGYSIELIKSLFTRK